MKRWHCLVLTAVMIGLSPSTKADEWNEANAKDCMAQAKPFVAETLPSLTLKPLQVESLGPDSVLPLDPDNILLACEKKPEPSIVVFLHRHQGSWRFQVVGHFECLEMAAQSALTGTLTSHTPCPLHGYDAPTCQTDVDTFSVKGGKLVLSRTKSTTKEICKICDKLPRCGRREIRNLALERHRKGDSAAAYELLVAYWKHFKEQIQSSGGLEDPWFASDLLLYATKAGQPCDFALEVVAQVNPAMGDVGWNDKYKKAIETNKKKCGKNAVKQRDHHQPKAR